MNPDPIEDFDTAPWPLPVWQEPMTREQYEREQIADAQSEQAWEANSKEHNK